MKYEFRPKNKILGFIIFCAYFLLILLLYKVLIPENFFTLGIVYISISGAILLLFIFHILYGFLDLIRKITVTQKGLVIKKPFKVIEIQWSEITEFIKQEKGFGVWAGWKYSLKLNRNSKKQIQIADDNDFDNIHVLIHLIFKFAIAAKFLEIRNDTLVPFIKRYKTSEWKKM